MSSAGNRAPLSGPPRWARLAFCKWQYRLMASGSRRERRPARSISIIARPATSRGPTPVRRGSTIWNSRVRRRCWRSLPAPTARAGSTFSPTPATTRWSTTPSRRRSRPSQSTATAAGWRVALTTVRSTWFQRRLASRRGATASATRWTTSPPTALGRTCWRAAATSNWHCSRWPTACRSGLRRSRTHHLRRRLVAR